MARLAYKRVVSRKRQIGSIGAFREPGQVGLAAGLLSFILLLLSLYSRSPIYLFAEPENLGSQSATLYTLFESPITPTDYTAKLPFFPLPGGNPVIYRTETETCQSPSCPTSLAFKAGRVFEPRHVYILMNLQEDSPPLVGQPLEGKRVGQVALQFETREDGFVYFPLHAGKEVRDWLVGLSDEIAVTNTTSSNTHEAYYGVAKGSVVPAVIDLVDLEVPAYAPDKPLIGVWISDSSSQSLNSRSPGFQVVSVVIEAPRGPNK